MLEVYKQEIRNLTTSEARTLIKEIESILTNSSIVAHSETLEKLYKLIPKPDNMGRAPYEGAKNHGVLRDLLSDVKRSM
jgi:hypothetical protein